MNPSSELPPRGLFPPTAWTVIQNAQEDDAQRAARALERLASVYWRPIYWTLRREWSQGPEDARDLTQDYFAHFLEERLFAGVQPERGRFRAYVKATLRNFVLNRRRDATALKRGGGVVVFALEELAEAERVVDPTHAPDGSFERELVRAILDRALADLRAECEREGRAGHFHLFEAYYVAEAGGAAPQYADLEERFDLGAQEVKHRLAGMRARFKKHVIGYLRDGLSDDEELIAEVTEVFRT